MPTFEQLVAEFEQQRGRKLSDKEREGCRQLWESTLKPQLQTENFKAFIEPIA